MESLLNTLHLKVNEKISLRNPESSDLGKKILTEGHKMMNETGFEAFTFKKLALKLKTTESSLYRYFESKHHLLNYFLSWYWSFQEYRIVMGTTNVKPASAKLVRVIELLCEELPKKQVDYFDISLLQKISINENTKAYLVHEVDLKNKDGFYLAYKKLCMRISEIISDVNPQYKFPNMLASTLIEGVNHQKFYRQHLPSLSNAYKNEKQLNEFFLGIILQSAQKKK